MQNYSQMSETFRNKFSRANMAQCNYALADIAETVHSVGSFLKYDAEYMRKLECEQDAVRERMQKIAGKKTCPTCDGQGVV